MDEEGLFQDLIDEVKIRRQQLTKRQDEFTDARRAVCLAQTKFDEASKNLNEFIDQLIDAT